jgi:hypothetical protein
MSDGLEVIKGTICGDCLYPIGEGCNCLER